MRNSTAESYTYSQNGKIQQTSDPMSIPSTATWATISSFEIDGTPGDPIQNTVFQYSMNGSDVLTATTATEIPPNALWATLVSFHTAWVEISNVQFTTYNLNRPTPSVVSFSISSDGGNSQYAKPGDSLTVTLITDRPIMEPILKIAGRTMFAEGGGTTWQGSLYLFDYNVEEGPIPVSAEFYSLAGAPGPVLSTTTDSTSLIHDKMAPTLSYTLSPAGATNQNVTVQVTASDAGSGVEQIKWAEGAQDASYFLAEGTAFTDSFTASTNGIYTVYARDRIGKVTLMPVTVANIDREAPTLTLSPSTTAPTNTDVVVTAEASDNVAIGKRLWAEGTRDAAYFQSGNGTSFTTEFFVAANGTYTAYVEDTAGNEALATITVSNLLRQAPSIALTPFPSFPTNEPVTVGIEAHSAGEEVGISLVALRWAKGERDVAFFADGGGKNALLTEEFEASENGLYSVYARDEAGNVAISFINISNIDREAPTLTLTPSTTAPTKASVTIAVNAADTGSGMESVRWASAAPIPDFPWPSSEVEDGEFTVEMNGTYTVIAIDQAGNETIRQLTVANIFRDAPTLVLIPETTQPVGGKVTVSVQAAAQGAGNSISDLLWSEGERSIGYFREGLSEDIQADKKFDAEVNGTYTVYVRDAAGNEALETIEIDNIRRTNASLLSLVAWVGEEELAFSPTFDPEQQNYELKVGTKVSSMTLEAAAEDEDATVTVNGKALVRGETASIPLNFGVNTIRIVVSAHLPSVQKIYTIKATREGLPSSGGSSSAAFTAWLNGKPAPAVLNETASQSPDGRMMKELQLEDASAIVALAQTSRENELRIGLIGEYAPQVDAVKLRLSAQALSQLSAHNIRLTLDIGAVAYELPTGTLAVTGDELVVELGALRQPKDAEKTLSDAKAAGAGELQVKLVGVPAEVTANVTGGAVEAAWLVLPLPEGIDSAALRKLAVLIVNGDGSKSIVPGTIRYDLQGRATGIAVHSDASGRAAVLQAEPIKALFERYVSGYTVDSFGPDRSVTRAELAALLAKLTAADGGARTGDSSAAAFRDVPQTHWAADAIAQASAAGWMGGRPDGLFSPNDPLTRAELATVLVRWRQVQASGQPRFPDAASHWAAAAIATSERRGWMIGYEDGSFRPDQSVTRAEAVTILNRVLGRPSLPDGGQAWSDVPASHWAAGAIRSASQTYEALRYLSGEVERAQVHSD
ncbi:cadherin-like beta sandwich domain-containing protein [Tumebacillus lipolyticus]|uniref:S-layer homology domain-containing protein n=1 Tax=Tumebacillus lipolyticus TaxID=1280370 RepID=A0ABW4ZXR4_9BACL